MRLVRIKVSDKVRKMVRLLCERNRFNDTDFVEDLFVLAASKGTGIPDDKRLEALIDAYTKYSPKPNAVGTRMTVSVLLKKKRMLLRQLVAHPLFGYLQKNKRTPREITERLFVSMRRFYALTRQSQCMTCTLLSQCEFGKSYGDKVQSIGLVTDPDPKLPPHANCPEKPIFDSLEEMRQALAQAKSLAQQPAAAALATQVGNHTNFKAAEQLQEDDDESEAEEAQLERDSSTENLPLSISEPWEDVDDMFGVFEGEVGNNSGGDGGHDYHTPFDSQSGVNLQAHIIEKLSLHNFILWQLSRKLASKLAKAKTGTMRPSPAPSSKSKLDTMESAADLTKVLPSDQVADDATFQAKAANKSLNVRRSLSGGKKHLVYVLIDTSGSMRQTVATRGPTNSLWMVATRGTLAASFGLALTELVSKEQGIMYVRGFDDYTSSLASARSPEEYTQLKSWLTCCSFMGGGTNIPGAIIQAATDIAAAKDELRDAEILIITDGDQWVSEQQVIDMRTALGPTVLNVLNVNSSGAGGAEASLMALSDHYMKVNAKSSLDQLIELVGGKKKPATQPSTTKN